MPRQSTHAIIVETLFIVAAVTAIAAFAANPLCDVVLPTGLDHERNALVAQADLVIHVAVSRCPLLFPLVLPARASMDVG